MHLVWDLHVEKKLPQGLSIARTAAEIFISPKKTFSFYEDGKTPIMTNVTYDHTHIMEKAIRTTCPYGFMLRDLTQEFISRFSDELLLRDRYANAIGSNGVSGRHNLGACIGTGNSRFFNYSLFGRYYLLL